MMMNQSEITIKVMQPGFCNPYSNEALNHLLRADRKQEYPTVSTEYPILRKFKDYSSNGLTRCKAAYISLNDGFAVRIINGGVDGSKIKKKRTGSSRKRFLNVLSTYRAQFIDVEIETDIHGFLENENMNDQEIIRENFLLVRTFTEFKNCFDTL
jgi:hypothetical protein